MPFLTPKEIEAIERQEREEEARKERERLAAIAAAEEAARLAKEQEEEAELIANSTTPLARLEMNNLQNPSAYFSYDSESTSIIFALMSNDFKLISGPSGCRGYIMDAHFASIRGEGAGGEWSKSYGTIPLENVYMLAAGTMKAFTAERQEAMMDFIHQMEEHLGFEKTIFTRAINIKKCNAFMLTGDKRWHHAPFLLSFYLFCLRTMAPYFHVKGEDFKDTLQKFYAKCEEYQKSIGPPREFPFKNADRNGFLGSYEFIKRFLKYGPDPLFMTDRNSNFPRGVGSHGYGMVCMSMYQHKNSTYHADQEARVLQGYAHRSEDLIEKWVAENMPKVETEELAPELVTAE